jgi:nitroimidazol reductase NimA-like FMN-containing flavoprotein (pyridoxamine 5'-phosphate oxidase superfamily)
MEGCKNMFRPMRRFKQQLTEAECEQVLLRNTAGVLAVLGDDDYPYAVPISYYYEKGKLYFHCALTGHKLDALQKHAQCSYCVIDQNEVIPERFTTHFRSVIAFGKAKLLQGDAKKQYLLKLATKFSPNNEEGCLKTVEGALPRVNVLEMTIEHLSGKESNELAQAKVK